MTTYKSAIARELILPISIILGGTGTLIAYEKIWAGLAIVLLVVAFIAYMFLTTYYQVDNSILKIKCRFFFRKLIPINTIKEIKETSNPISSPATSLGRIVISYNKFDSVIISPKEKGAFINHLSSINPGIKKTLKKQR